FRGPVASSHPHRNLLTHRTIPYTLGGTGHRVNGGVMPGQKAGEAERREQILAAAYEIAATDGLDRLTVRRVAGEAGLSHGLVHFHFRTKAVLLLALLDWVLERTPEYALPTVAPMDAPLDRLLALLRQEIARLTSDRRRVHLFFDFWL